MVVPESDAGGFAVDVASDASCHVVTVSGELDISQVGPLRHLLDTLIVEGPSRLVIDLRGISFMDSSGLGALVWAHKKAKVLRGSLTVVTRDGHVQELLALTGLRHVLRVFDTVEAARLSA